MRCVLIVIVLMTALGCSNRPPSEAPPAAARPVPQTAASAPPPTTPEPPAAPATAAPPGPAISSVPPQPAFREVTIPAGTGIAVVLSTAIASDQSKVEDRVEAHVVKPIVAAGVEAIPANATVVGTVTEARQSGRVKGRARLAMRFDRLTASDDTYAIATSTIAREARATKGEDAKKIGIGAGAGAVVGAIVGGKKGALVGGAVGAGAGTGVVAATRGEEVRLDRGARVTITLREPLTVRVRQ